MLVWVDTYRIYFWGTKQMYKMLEDVPRDRSGFITVEQVNSQPFPTVLLVVTLVCRCSSGPCVLVPPACYSPYRDFSSEW